MVWSVALLVVAGSTGMSRVGMGQDDDLAARGTIENALQLVQTAADGKSSVVFALADELANSVPQGEYWLGVQVAALPEVVKKQLVLEDGLAVEEVTPDSPAAKAEIKKYDILVKAGDAPVKNIMDLVKAVDASQGKEMTIVIIRDGKHQTLKVVSEKRPKSEGVEAVKRAVTAARPELAGEIKQLEEALEKLKGKVGKEGVGFWYTKPAVVAPRVDLRLSDAKIAEAITKSLKPAEFPKDLSVQINKQGDQPAKIHVKRGDKEEWEATDDKLKDLPDDIRPHVERLMGRLRGPGMAATTSRTLRFSPEGKIEGEVEIAPTPPKAPASPRAPMPPKPPTGPRPPVGPKEISPPQPPTTPANRAMTVRTHRVADGDADSKLDAIIKKLDERSETVEKLDKKVEELRKEIDQLRGKDKRD
jgi:PDZ domain-containing protein